MVLLQRGELLGDLIGRTRSKPELTDTFDVSRSTVDRAIRTLESHGLVARAGGAFTATLAGRLAYDAYREYGESLAVLDETSDLLCHLEPDCDVAPEMLRGAEVLRAGGPASFGPDVKLEHHVRNAVKFVGISRAMSNPHIPGIMVRRVKAGEVEMAIVYREDLVAFMHEERRAERTELAKSGRYRAYAAEDVPYSLFIFDMPDDAARTATDGGTTAEETTDEEAAARDAGAREGTKADDGSRADDWRDADVDADGRIRRVAILSVYDDTYDLRGLIVNDSPEAVAWADSIVDWYRRKGEEITDTFLSGTEGAGDDRGDGE